MNVTSYNVTDVAYHYIGLRVLAGTLGAIREEQTATVSRNVLKFARDKALRLMLSEPRGSFETVGEKVCQELVHFGFAFLVHRKGYELTETGRAVLRLLEQRSHGELRRTMVRAHLATYDNVRMILTKHIDVGSIHSPTVEKAGFESREHLISLLTPTFAERAQAELDRVLEGADIGTPKKLENALRQAILDSLFTDPAVSLPIFRSICDRLVSLRLLNVMRASVGRGEVARSYSPCSHYPPELDWHVPLKVPIPGGLDYTICLSEPDMNSPPLQRLLVGALYEAFESLTPQAGYFDLPEVRDYVCDKIRIPESSFDEGVNVLLDSEPSPITVGLAYERISGRRKPLVRAQASSQIFNLIRRA